MKRNPHPKVTFFLALIFLVAFSCESPTPKDLQAESIIPQPVELSATGSSFRITEDTKITFEGSSEELESIGSYFSQLLKPATGFDLKVESGQRESNGNFHFDVSGDDADLGKEGYRLTITDKVVKVAANSAEGIFRSIQTIRQLLPPAIERKSKQNIPWEIASGSIADYPTYAYRGAMLDVSRHFFDVAEVKQYIDWLARYKMNILHLHLADDQGWRIEIKKWPKLTEVGGSTEVGGGKGGFFTQEQYADLINYAAERYITIVPEIDMPGHTNAALASYAELNCDGKLRELYTGTEVGFSTLCTEKEIVFEFIEDVVTELVAMTPGPYFHIGGDESHSTDGDDYLYFVNRVQDIVTSQGKQMIGWDEIVSTGVKSGTIAQVWASNDRAKEAVEKGLKVIMSPASKAYLDMKYDSTTVLGLNWAGYIEVDDGYNWYPEQMIAGVEKEDILGVEAPLWSETVTNMEEIEYMVFPRLLGYAEIGWSKPEMRNWENYKVRLSEHSLRFTEMGINYYPSQLVDWRKEEEK